MTTNSEAFKMLALKLAWATERSHRIIAHANYLGVYWLQWRVCDPPHRVTNEQHRDDLIEALRAGWNGPALVGYELGDKCQLLSGSHRHDASRILDRLMPVRLFNRSVPTEAYGDLDKWRAMMDSAPHIELSWEPPSGWEPQS